MCNRHFRMELLNSKLILFKEGLFILLQVASRIWSFSLLACLFGGCFFSFNMAAFLRTWRDTNFLRCREMEQISSRWSVQFPSHVLFLLFLIEIFMTCHFIICFPQKWLQLVKIWCFPKSIPLQRLVGRFKRIKNRIGWHKMSVLFN